uniref:Olfactory receptor 146-like n=1 Tax=Nothobranchius furzeri TaxID=105023 RepID=A0A8C6M424_NOTFU
MDFFNSAFGKNITFIHPAYFIISGFTGIPNIKYYYVFLFLVYIASVLGNAVVMVVIYLDHNLRTPKYIAVFNLAFVDLLSNTVLVPKVIDIFLFNHFIIPYIDCLVFCFFSYTCLSMQALNLVALSCDRVVAIMFPLHYHTKITNRSMFSLMGYFWLFVVVAVLTSVALLTRLTFCNSVVINSYFCDYGQIFEMACNDYFPNVVISYLLRFLILWVPLLVILSSYFCIGYALAKVASFQERAKALKTCTSHISLVAMYFFPVIITFTRGPQIHPNARIINLSLTSIFPPMLNPIIYVLQTQEIKNSLKKMLEIRNQIQSIFK